MVNGKYSEYRNHQGVAFLYQIAAAVKTGCLMPTSQIKRLGAAGNFQRAHKTSREYPVTKYIGSSSLT